MIKWFPLVAVIALACSEVTLPSGVGTWTVSLMNGVTVPAPTTTGHTFRHGVLALSDDKTGQVEYCTTLPAHAVQHLLRWRALDPSHLEFTYLDAATEPLIDTAVVSGQTMNWRAKVVEPDLGATFWRLVLTSFEPSDERLVCS